jgi:hypothetical protein
MRERRESERRRSAYVRAQEAVDRSDWDADAQRAGAEARRRGQQRRREREREAAVADGG